MENYNTSSNEKNKINWLHILIAVIFMFLIGKVILDWQNPQGPIIRPINNTSIEKDNKKNLSETTPEKIIKQTSLITKNFSSPYPLLWQEAWSGKETIDYALTKVSLGKRTAPPGLQKTSGDYYKANEEIFALTLYFKVKTSNWNGPGALCIKPSLRRLINEEGDLLPPDNQDFYSANMKMGCAGPNRTYSDQEVIFVVPENEKEFTFTTGGKSNIFFSVTNLNNNLTVEKAPTSESGN